MNARWAVYRKEVRESLRDRRALMNTLGLGPLLGPLIFLVLIRVMVGQELKTAERPLPVAVQGAEYAPHLVEALRASGAEIATASADPAQAVRDEEVEFAISIPKSYPQDWQAGRPATVFVYFDSSRKEVGQHIGRLKGMLEGYSRQVGAMRLMVRGVAPLVASPIAIAERDQATPASRGAMLLAMLPYMLILTTFIGGLFLAVDATAGERERQSLEPLFTTPVSRESLLAGKVLATATFAGASVLMSLMAFFVVGRFLPTAELGMTVDLSARFLGLVLPVMVPLVLCVSALQIFVAAFAKTLREAQTQLGLLQIVPVIPVLLLTVLPFKTALWMYALPLVGQQLVISRALRGDSVGLLPELLVISSTALAALLAYLAARRAFRQERLALSN
jgi:sodium transport system permease protein